MNALRICAFLILAAAPARAGDIPNPLIDYAAFADEVAAVGEVRPDRRVSEEEFLRLAAEPGTVILDARSAEKFARLHVRGARNLSLPDMTEKELARIIPSKSTRVLIYCNNNFLNAPDAFPTKAVGASLNLHTFTVLTTYGYTNVVELGPLIDVHRTRIEFEGTDAGRR